MVIIGDNGEAYSIYIPYVEITAERVNKQTDAAVAQPASIADQTANVLPVQSEEDISRAWVQARLNQMILTDKGADAVLNSDLPHDYKKDALIYKMHHGEAAQFGLAFMNSALMMAQGAMLLRGLGYNTPEIPSFSPGRVVSFADDVVISQTDDVVVKGGSGKQARLKEIMNDPKQSSADRGWLRNDARHIKTGNKRGLRVPRNGRKSPGRKKADKGYELAHPHNAPASKGNGYGGSKLKNHADHKVETRLHRKRY